MVVDKHRSEERRLHVRSGWSTPRSSTVCGVRFLLAERTLQADCCASLLLLFVTRLLAANHGLQLDRLHHTSRHHYGHHHPWSSSAQPSERCQACSEPYAYRSCARVDFSRLCHEVIYFLHAGVPRLVLKSPLRLQQQLCAAAGRRSHPLLVPIARSALQPHSPAVGVHNVSQALDFRALRDPIDHLVMRNMGHPPHKHTHTHACMHTCIVRLHWGRIVFIVR